MGVSVDKSYFTTRDEAVKDIASRELVARDGAMAAGDLEDIHWHDTGLAIYVLKGLFETKDAASGDLLTAGPGDRITIPPRTLHAARCPDPAEYVVGFESQEAMAGFRPRTADEL
jgi:quercetin dioxygenase-like cupin family protein